MRGAAAGDAAARPGAPPDSGHLRPPAVGTRPSAAVMCSTNDMSFYFKLDCTQNRTNGELTTIRHSLPVNRKAGYRKSSA